MSLSSKQIGWLVSLISLLIVSVFLVEANFVARENDTRLYNRFVKDLSERPFSEIVAPRWNNFSQHYAEKETPFVRDHPPGQFLISVVLVKLGFPKEHTHYIVNMAVRIISLWLMYLIALRYLSDEKALYVPLLIQIIPMNITYQLRANHEHWLLLLALLGTWAALDLSKTRNWFWVGVAVIGSFSIKGLAFIPIASGLLLYLLFNVKSKKKVLISFLITTLSLIILSIGFELLFREATNGISFFNKYFEVQILSRSVNDSNGLNLMGRVNSFIFYAGRLVAYSAPFSLIRFYFWIRKKDKSLKNIFREIKTNPMLIMSLTYLFFFSVSTRIASRYTYPAYFLLAIYALVEILKIKQPRVFSKRTMYIATFSVFTIFSVANILANIGNDLKYPH